jgi:GNAT superfamily N-acetyltransferase
MIIRHAAAADIAEIRGLFREYSDWLGVDLSFQNFEQEVAGLPGDYTPPSGCLLIAETAHHAAGCIALRRLDDEIGEMKRLYVRPEFRGTGLGRRLVLAIIEEARIAGYRRIRLDTLPQMGAAHQLYESLGFKPIEAYRHNPIPGTRFLERDTAVNERE